MPTFAVLGFRPHTYWTAVAAVAGPPDAPRILDRRKLTFAADREKFIYHQAAEGDHARAAELIAGARVRAEANAAREIAGLVAELKTAGVEVCAAVTAASTAKLPDSLEQVLAVHARLHAAEGNFARDAIAAGCAAAGLPVHRVVERELPALTADLLGVGIPAVAARLKAMGEDLGPPWGEDFKLCVQAAWLHLAEPAVVSG